MALPEKPAGERLKLWIYGHQGEPGQLSLGGQQTIKGVAVGHWVAASMQALLQGDRQQLKPLGCKQPGQIIEQFPGRWQLAQVHLGGDLPAGSGAHNDRSGEIADGGVGGRRETIRLSQPPQG